jgi:hypothetical protein
MKLKSFSELFVLKEMSTVVRHEGYRITIYPEPQGNPSFHLIFKNEWEVVLQIKDFSILENKTRNPIFQKNKQLPSYIKKDLIDILSQIRGKFTTWDFLITTWNSNNPDYEVDINLPIPE